MRLIRYAGFDPNEDCACPKLKGVYKRFLAGSDTAALARYYRVRESTVLRWINEARSRALGLPSPLEAS
jgi:transposase-like protein